MTATVELEKDEDGALCSYDIEYNDDLAAPYFLSVEGEDAIYITIQTAGETYDFSQIPGGLGVYRLPYEVVDDCPVFHTEELENICPLPSDTQVEWLSLSQDGSQILLLTTQNEAYAL